MADLLAVGGAGGRAHDREVVDGDGDVAAVDLGEAGDLAVRRRAVAVLRVDARDAEQARLDEAALVDEVLDPLAGVHHAGLAPPLQLLGPAHAARLAAAGLQLFEQSFEIGEIF